MLTPRRYKQINSKHKFKAVAFGVLRHCNWKRTNAPFMPFIIISPVFVGNSYKVSQAFEMGSHVYYGLLALLALLAPPQKLPDLSTLWVLCAAACARGRYPLTQTTSQAGNKRTDSKKVDKQNLQLTSLRRTSTSTENKSV